MSNQVLSVVAYSSEVIGDLSQNSKFKGMAHVQSNLGVWAQKESGTRFPVICLEGAARVKAGYVVLVSLHLGELFNIYVQNENGELRARHARGAVFIPDAAISAVTQQSLDELLRVSESWESNPVRVNTPDVAAMLEDNLTELRRWVIIKDGVDTGARFPAISFGQEKALAIISCEEVVLESPIQGFDTSWQISSFMASGDYRFRLPGAGGSSTVNAVSAKNIDIDAFIGRDVDAIADAQVAKTQAVTPVAEIPAAPAVSQVRKSFIRA